MNQSIKQKILSYLTEKRNWVYGGVIDDYIRQTDGHKASNSSRRCRELVNEGKLNRRLVKVEGNNVVQYKINDNQTPTQRTEHPDPPDTRNPRQSMFTLSPIPLPGFARISERKVPQNGIRTG